MIFKFRESFIKWFADCSHCNQKGPFPTKKTCLASMNEMESLATNSSCRSTVLLVLSIVVSTALDHCQLLLLPTAGQLDQCRQAPVLRSQTFRRLQHLLRYHFYKIIIYNVLMTRADGICLAMTLGLVSTFSKSQCVSHFDALRHNLSREDSDVFNTSGSTMGST